MKSLNRLPLPPRLAGYVCISFLFIFSSALNNSSASSQELRDVGYGGVFTAGKEENYPIYSRAKRSLNAEIRKSLERMSLAKKLPFNLIFETHTESMKEKIDDPYSLAVVITRDDVANERFSSIGRTIYKTFVNAGMVVILYQTVDDDSGNDKKKNTIVFSTPLVGYSMNLEDKTELSQTEIDDLFIRNATVTLEDHLAKRLTKISLGRISGIVTDVQKGKAIINIGEVQGLASGQKVTFLRDGKELTSGKIVGLRKADSVVHLQNSKIPIEKNFQVSGINIKGISTETYQVVGFKISSKKAAAVFEEKSFGEQVSHWFSDFLVDRAGKAVFPPKVGGEWAQAATENSFAVFVKDGREHRFELPPPRYPIHLDLSGIASKITDKNNIAITG